MTNIRIIPKSNQELYIETKFKHILHKDKNNMFFIIGKRKNKKYLYTINLVKNGIVSPISEPLDLGGLNYFEIKDLFEKLISEYYKNYYQFSLF